MFQFGIPGGPELLIILILFAFITVGLLSALAVVGVVVFLVLRSGSDPDESGWDSGREADREPGDVEGGVVDVEGGVVDAEDEEVDTEDEEVDAVDGEIGAEGRERADTGGQERADADGQGPTDDSGTDR